jgi:predicted DsbA family dithiol-disulfide isomerase
VEWRAFELHPEIPPEGMVLPAHWRARLGGASEPLQEMAREAGMALVTPEIIPNSRRALEATEYARERGKHAAFHAAVFEQLYGRGQDIGRWEVLRTAAEAVGLDPDAMQEATAAGQYRAVVDSQIAEGRGLGISGVPTFVFDDRYALVGAQPYALFREVMARLAQDADDHG